MTPMLVRVDAAITRLEAENGGAVCPIRAVPIDMIADAVVNGFTSGEPTDAEIDAAVRAVVQRYDSPFR